MNTSNSNGAGSLTGPSNRTVVNGLDLPFTQVREFHKAFDHPYPKEPTMQPIKRAVARGEWIMEEVNELSAATTLVDQADAYIDILYFALGGMVELGILPQRLFDRVHEANMAKLHIDENGDTFVKRRDDGKVVKPEGWVENHAPERHMFAEIETQCVTQPLNGMENKK